MKEWIFNWYNIEDKEGLVIRSPIGNRIPNLEQEVKTYARSIDITHWSIDTRTKQKHLG
jgi:hypothetical protein